MKHIRFEIMFLAVVDLLAACIAAPTTSVHEITKRSSTDLPAQTSVGADVEEAEIRNLVENFGNRLQNVSLQSPNVASEIENQYAEFVSPALLEKWLNNIPAAPGRIVSSPWPDRIEIRSLEKVNSGKYVVTGFVIQVTSTEIVNGGEAIRSPIRIVVQGSQGGWLITEYAEE